MAKDGSNRQWRNDLDYAIGQIGSLSYRLVLASDFTKALEVADEALSLSPDQIWIYGNRAHALMFLGQADEARAIYVQYRGKSNVVGEKSWETTVLDDFAELRKAGLTRPLMDEIESVFGKEETAEPGTAQPEQAAQ